MMKKYIAPEMEIAKFAAEDIMTGSSPVVTPAIKYDANYANYEGFSDHATYGTF